MQLNGKSRHSFHEALLSAFPTPAKLKQMVSFELDENLDAIAIGGNYSEVVFKLIEWAEAEGKVKKLLDAARSSNPGNPKLKSFDEQIRNTLNNNTTPTFVNSGNISQTPPSSDFEYDVALSFAGEERDLAERLANALRQRYINVFYDEFEESKLWGKNLFDYLSNLYENEARFCVMFLSKHYAWKDWTRLERQSAQARAFKQNQEYILPLRIDDTPIPGILETISYLDFQNPSQQDYERVADNVVKKLKAIE